MSADESEDPRPLAPSNGESHIESAATATPAKRKRSTQDDRPAVESTSSTLHDRSNLHETLRNLVGLLLKHDTELQLLSCPFPTSTAKPRVKRAKTSGDQDTSNIRTRVESSHYNTLQEFLADIERASAAVIERNQNQTNGTKPEGSALTEVVNLIAAFKKHMNTLVGQSFVNQSDIKAEYPDEDDEQLLSLVSNSGAREDKQALTMFGGNQSQPKQLFSSLQKSVQVPLQSESGAEKVVEVQEQLREGGLPNGIATTRVVPYNLESAEDKPKRTFGDVFAPRSGLPPAEPRKRRRSTAVSWIDPFDLVLDVNNFSGESNNYSFATLPATQWLQYGGVSSSSSYWSRVEKHNEESGFVSRHEDPALWTDDESAILQGVYSSFAPSFDSSNAVIQADSKNLVWWGQRGARRLRTLLSLPYPENGLEDSSREVDVEAIDKMDESFLDEVAESLKPKDYAEYLAQTEQTPKAEPESREIDDVLAEVSNLLETLASYQNIRRTTLPSDDEISESNESPAPEINDAETPSDEERAVYEDLKSKLVAIISNLPPYVVAKVNGDQLAELNISQKIIIDNPDWQGTMEKDDYSLQQDRAAAIAAQTNAANRASTPSSARPANYQAPHSAYNQRAFNANARVSQTPSGFPTPQPTRQPSTGGSFPPGYTGGRPPSTPSQRPGSSSQFPQANPQYNQASNVPQFQRPTPNGYTPQPYSPRPGQPAQYGTPQGRTPSASAPSASAQRYQQYATQTPSQGYLNSAAAAAYARSAADQSAVNKTHLAAQARQSPSTPQPHYEARQSQEGSLTPGKQNGTPIQS
ncbi:hypothetical protein N7478_003293 [Penicillium angulare]|uniref:uncharacterized protein n=1 Tax=Penicillium angulare TaxID=116970 RepID=UPI0025407C37|nr:uncharacterized protein N7478_003293 [Penicillium angulare]KAJ5287607.1 hypothetical protein N7478_003293 [Penicillium angulare]